MLQVRDMSLHGHKGVRKTLLGGAVTLTLFLYGLVGIDIPFIDEAPATLGAQATSQDLRGYAWSDNIGWISFSCLDTATCDIVNYGVDLNSDNTISGYAWSDNIGWIKFGGLSDFPTGGSTTASNARLSGSNVVGWARACAGTTIGNCSSATSRTDGWDGWIALSGDGFGISLGDGAFDGYAWGGSVVGWVDWKPFIDSDDGCTSSCGGGEGGGCQGVCVSDPFVFGLNTPSSVNVQRGESGQALIETELISGFSENVTFGHGAVVGLSNLGFSRSSCNPGCTTTLTFTVDNDAAYGQHPVVITAVSDSGVTESKTLYINVPAPDITDSISCSADKSSVLVGQTVTWSAFVAEAGTYTYTWSDATGQIGTGSSIQKTYTSQGLKGVTVSVSGSGGATGECTATVTVRNRPIIEEF